MKKHQIISVLSELHKITGFRVSLHGADYSEIAAFPEEKCDFCRLIHSIDGEFDRCMECDKTACKKALASKDTYIYQCRYGLIEAVSPLYNFGTLTGFLMMGQVHSKGSAKPSVTSLAKGNSRMADDFEAAIEKIPDVKADMIRSYVKIMTICAQYLTLSNAIPSNKPSVAEMAKKYIFDNYSSKFGIKDMCDDIGCSKATLITAFKKQYGITINHYITEVRLGEAVRMLSAGDKTIGEIATASGFSDQSYFSKVFSAWYGVPPSEYKERNK